ncbi:VWA domain-containing protein [Pseudomonas citronellolis]|uniref:VWA domain-containing protein n=1 Tax=Pseudomonas citronellolis TaxID=53408 RepID=UPI00209E6C26|nr:VWA domain-containing protein [Pseudomonas citronellolis]MCP1604890.1 Ca-activated chloride channel family protein [Pseudomonas citronellolis]MCP1655871.1 Ca-activated chloride channel family protein [Pseudomonas citronellolis]MCP1722921.1 Ca-activated chloride channel family protein [Pseudomonas citronellolis]
MDIDLAAFHFLRPLWLLTLLPGVLLPLLWTRRHDLVRRLDGIIAPHLLQHLVITPQDNQRLRPVHLLGALLVLGGIAAAGPTWEQDRPAFLDNRAPLILALDLSSSMDADDVPPSRLEAAKHKLHDLIQRRAGGRTALLAYAGSAHLVLPATEDPALLDGFLQALSSNLIERQGKDALGAIEQAKRLLAAEQAPGTLVLLTDGADREQFAAIGKALQGSELQVLVLAVGSPGGPAPFDAEGLKGLAGAADAPLGSLTLNDDDLDWIELHAQQHFQAAQDDGRELHWKDAGYWLCWPLLGLALLNIRKGWRVHWLGAALLALGLGWAAPPAHAGPLADAFFTADQQGRWAFEHEHYPQAAAHFQDTYWKGIAAYRAADYQLALATFARLDTAPAYFYLGNTYVHLSKFEQAIAAYRQALARQPQFPEAQANLALAEALQKDHDAQQEAGPPDEKADKEVFDNTAGKGKTLPSQTGQASSDEQWLSNLTTSPARFLKRKFLLQDAAHAPATEASP